MKFEEEFPSLKGEGLSKEDTNCIEVEDNAFYVGDIMKHCLDKAIVRDAIDRICGFNTVLFSDREKKIHRVIAEAIKKELGI